MPLKVPSTLKMKRIKITVLNAFLNLVLFWPLFESCFNKRRFKSITATYPNYIFSAFLLCNVVVMYFFSYSHTYVTAPVSISKKLTTQQLANKNNYFSFETLLLFVFIRIFSCFLMGPTCPAALML